MFNKDRFGKFLATNEIPEVNALDAAMNDWDENKHPRGGSKNKGQFKQKFENFAQADDLDGEEKSNNDGLKKEIKEGMDNLRSNMFETDNGDVFYVQFNYDDMNFEFGGATNSGMAVDYTVPYDTDASFDSNFTEAAEKALEHYNYES